MGLERLEVGVDVLGAVLGVDEAVEAVAGLVVAVAVVHLDHDRPGRAGPSGSTIRWPPGASVERSAVQRSRTARRPVTSSQMGASPGSDLEA